jgi:membrane-associated protease RseP (regulator of RpoE activity)
VTEIRSRVSVPLFVEPPMFWVTPIVPEIDGVVLNSPAHRAGLKAGDIVRSIEGNTIRSRIESEATLDRLHLARAQTVRIEVERQEGRIECVLEEASDGRDTYPYNGEFFYRGENFGIFHVEDFRLHYVQSVIDIARRYNAHRVMLFTSSLVAPIFETLVENIPEFTQALADVEVHLETIEENSFGGNYDVMDSRVVADYADAIRKRIHGGFRPDLILIPDAFGGSWGTDVFGCSESDLSLEFGIPIERIEWLLVYGREV